MKSYVLLRFYISNELSYYTEYSSKRHYFEVHVLFFSLFYADDKKIPSYFIYLFYFC